ncbi:MAG: CbiX/SirB N-terminal domain-containing protein [Microthrixaceae bacterium]
MTSVDSTSLNLSDPSIKIVLLVAHGSRNPRAAVEHAQLCEKVQAQANGALGDLQADSQAVRSSQVQVRPAYLELAEPSIAQAIDTAVNEGALHIRLLPHFLNSGNHVMRDLPEAVAEAETKHPGVSIELAEHLGADAGLVTLLTTRVLAD